MTTRRDLSDLIDRYNRFSARPVHLFGYNNPSPQRGYRYAIIPHDTPGQPLDLDGPTRFTPDQLSPILHAMIYAARHAAAPTEPPAAPRTGNIFEPITTKEGK